MSNEKKEVDNTDKALHIANVSGSSSKDCKNCKHHSDRNGGLCEHPKWSNCVIRDNEGYVKDLVYHNYH